MDFDFTFVLDHTVFNDIYRDYPDGEKELQKYSKFIQDYLIIRKAMVDKRMAITSREVFDRIVNRTIINPKNPITPNIWIAINDLVDINSLTYTNSEVLYKESIIILATHCSFKAPPNKIIILLSNSKKSKDKILTLYAKYGRPLRKIEEAPFKVMDCKEAFNYLKEKDEKIFLDISKMLKKNYEFIE